MLTKNRKRRRGNANFFLSSEPEGLCKVKASRNIVNYRLKTEASDLERGEVEPHKLVT